MIININENSMYFIRRPPTKILSLESYLESGRITKERYDLLIEHIRKRSNIVIGGETGSGKTTLLNAVIDKIRELTPDDSFYVVEDIGEIQCKARDCVLILASRKDCLKAVATALRCNVSHIIFGEFRYDDADDATYEVLKAWNLGYTGGITTIHANCTQSMLSRIRDLLREAIPGELPDVAQSVQLLVHMKRTKNGPVVSEVVETKQIRDIEEESF